MNLDNLRTFSLTVFFAAFLIVPGISLEAKLPTHPNGDYKSDYWQFWFLYEQEKRPGQEEYIFRPFFSSYTEKQSAHTYQTVLYPLFYREKTNHWEKWTFLFLFNKDSMKHEDTGDDTDLILSPFFHWGSGETERDRYWGLFPLIGSTKSKISWSELNYFLFPIYANWSYKEFKAHAFLWPLIVFGSSDIRKEYRILPFFSIKEHVGKYRHYAFLWPFIQWGEDFLDKKEPTNYLFTFLYNYKGSRYGNMRSYSLLYIPLLGPFASYGYDRRTGEVDFNVLFFLFQYGYNNDKDYRKHIFFPFYGYYRFGGRETTFITPFYIHLRSDNYLLKSDYKFFLPFVWKMDQYFPKEQRSDEYFKIWPLFKWHKDTEGNESWNVFSLFPIRSLTVERNWDPIWSVIEYRKFTNGEKRLSLFMRLYTQRWNKDEFHVYIPFLLDLSLEQDRTNIQILYGLFGYQREYEKRTLQLLWFIKI